MPFPLLMMGRNSLASLLSQETGSNIPGVLGGQVGSTTITSDYSAGFRFAEIDINWFQACSTTQVAAGATTTQALGLTTTSIQCTATTASIPALTWLQFGNGSGYWEAQVASLVALGATSIPIVEGTVGGSYSLTSGTTINTITQGSYSAAFLASVVSTLLAYKSAGFKIAVGLGLGNCTPPWVYGITNGQFKDQSSNLATAAIGAAPNLVFCPAVRSAAATYITWMVQGIAAGGVTVDYYRIGLDSSGEMLYPAPVITTGTGSWWAFDALAQGVVGNLPAGVGVCPLQGWVPGAATVAGSGPYAGDTVTLTTPNGGATAWWNWYLGALNNAHQWNMAVIAAAGYNGLFSLTAPGVGAVPTIITNRLGLILAASSDVPTDLTMNVGAAWHLSIPAVANPANTVLDISSVYDGSGGTTTTGTSGANNYSYSTDTSDTLAQADPYVSGWSASRWLAWIAATQVSPALHVHGESPNGVDTPADATGCMIQAKGCGLYSLLWANDADMNAGNGTTTATPAQVITAFNAAYDPPTLTVTSTSLSGATDGTAYSTTLTATGGTTPYTWSISSGSLPAGLALVASTGVISGTPTATGTTDFTIKVTDSASPTQDTATAAVSIVVVSASAPLTITAVGSFYSVSGSGVVATASITPLAVGDVLMLAVKISSDTIQVSSIASSNATWAIANHDFDGSHDLEIWAGTVTHTTASVITITPSSSTAGIDTDLAMQEFSADGTSPVWSSTAGGEANNASSSTPSYVGLGTTSAGQLYFGYMRGATTFSAGGTAGFTYDGTADGNQVAYNPSYSVAGAPVADVSPAATTTTMSVVMEATGIPAALTITSTTLPNATQGTVYTTILTATGGVSPYSFSLSSGTLPAGLTLKNEGPSEISGTPTGTGISDFTLEVTDADSNTATAAVSLDVLAAATLTVTSTGLPGATQGTAYSTTLTATGGITPYSWSISSGSLPAGLSLVASTGVISGTPTGTGTSSFTIEVTDSTSPTHNTATAAVSILVSASGGTLVILNPAMQDGSNGNAYAATLVATGGTTPYTWTVSSGSLPGGLSLNASTGAITGTPTTTAVTSLTFHVADSASHTATLATAITVWANQAGMPNPNPYATGATPTQIFPNSIYTTPVPSSPILASNSSTLVSNFQSQVAASAGGVANINVYSYCPELYVVHGSTFTWPTISIIGYDGDTPVGTLPMPVPTNASPDTSGTDHQMCVWDLDNETIGSYTGPMFYEFWECTAPGTEWQTDTFVRAPTNDNWAGAYDYPPGPAWSGDTSTLSWSTAASRLSYGAFITVADLLSGSINHAISFAAANTGEYVAPATYYDGTETGTSIPEGTRFFFPSSVSMPSGLTPFAQMVFTAIQKYGAYLIDTAGNIAFYTENVTSWTRYFGAVPSWAATLFGGSSTDYGGYYFYYPTLPLPWGSLQATIPESAANIVAGVQ